MSQRTLRIPGPLEHGGASSDAGLQEAAREHVERHPGLLFLADVLRALHASPGGGRTPAAFFDAFSPQDVMEALGARPDLRARILKALTGGPTALLRRLAPAEVASQIDLLAVEDLPEAERTVRADADRALSVPEIYFKHVDPVDLVTYLPARAVWDYESQADGGWWKGQASAGARALMASELRSIRRHAILTDSEILDVLGDETFERHMPLSVRTALRTAARRAAAEGKPFTDADLFAGADGKAGGRDLVDDMVENIPLPELREVIEQVVRMLGIADQDAVTAPTKVPAARTLTPETATPTSGARVGPKPAASMPAAAPEKAAARAKPPAPPPARAVPAPPDADGLPQQDDDFTLVEELIGRG